MDEADFDTEHQGWSGAQVLDWLRQHQLPATGERIVTHGDASTPNILALDGRFSGLVDCGRLGVADPWQDLALACRSIACNIGQEHIGPFLGSYGANWDQAKYRYYCALDDMF